MNRYEIKRDRKVIMGLILIMACVLFLGLGQHAYAADASESLPEDGNYTVEVTMSGGTGRASIESPAKVTVKDGKMTATIIWSSSYYQYMNVNGKQYDPVNKDGNSTFEIPVVMDEDMPVQALTTAMSMPHLIDYTLHFDSSTLKEEGSAVSMPVIGCIALVLLVSGGILMKRRKRA